MQRRKVQPGRSLFGFWWTWVNEVQLSKIWKLLFENLIIDKSVQRWVIHSIRESQGTLFFFICQDWPEQARKTPYAIHSKFVGVKRRITYFLTKWVVFFHVYLDIFLCFFFSWKSSHCFRCLFIRSQITVKKKNTSGKKTAFSFIQSIFLKKV